MSGIRRPRPAQPSLADIESDFHPHETAAQFRRRAAASRSARLRGAARKLLRRSG